MITQINMCNVNSYKERTTLNTNKKINIIYGLNGSGKSSLSDYLYDMNNPDFKDCSTNGVHDEEILVYNTHFIDEYFYQPDSLKGIFTLSKINKDSVERIRDAERKKAELEIERDQLETEILKNENEFAVRLNKAETVVWEIKTRYSRGASSLEFCLDKLKGKKEDLLEYIIAIEKPKIQSNYSIAMLEKEMEIIKDSEMIEMGLLPIINIDLSSIELNPLLKTSIIGNENSTVSDLITKLGNPDWVKKGLEYIPQISGEIKAKCPFCQEETITTIFISNIKKYFDESYEIELRKIQELFIQYVNMTKKLPDIGIYISNIFIEDNKSDLESHFNSILQCLDRNKKQIEEKIKSPSQQFQLEESINLIHAFNKLVSENLNAKIIEHNKRIKNKALVIQDIKMRFWNIMRWDYNQTIGTFMSEKKTFHQRDTELNSDLRKIVDSVKMQNTIIAEQQKNTENIDGAIKNINSGLIELGIDGFFIEKHINNLYKITRNEKCDNTFQTLSEGEKMIISFLYFRELCKGNKTAQSSRKRKIVVIDDPISSLSHIFIFNIGEMIKTDFFKAPYEQVFLLTHSLYFFYEMTLSDHTKRKEHQNLFRIVKNSDGSQIFEMKYNEIQSDYHSYWDVLKNSSQPPALIAICMRNIIEHFFSFVEYQELNEVFKDPKLKENKYQAFCRYINRESHSDGKNIFDIKEYDYDSFREAFHLIFIITDYERHYEKMINI